MYYIIETNYVGPNQAQDQYIDADRIEISTSPAIDIDGDVRIDGSCGTAYDWSTYAHGEYATIDAARAVIADKFGEVRDSNPDGDSFIGYDDDVVEVYKPGKYAPLGSQETAEWACEGIQRDISADTTDERIAELVAEYEAEANSNGYTLDSNLDIVMAAHRQLRKELRKELADEVDD